MKKYILTALISLLLIAFACNSKEDKKNRVKPNRESIAQEILTTSPRYKELTKGLYDIVKKNGGSSIGVSLEGSPDAKNNKERKYSKTYDFTLFEMYTERKLNTTRFSFSPQKKQLYEYDAVYDELNPIEFDKNLLIKFENFNK